MSESAVILEGEVARRFNPVDKLRATNQDSSVSDWVPSDTLDLGNLMASENNLYLANIDDDCDAYEEVEVDVSTDLEDADDETKNTHKITGTGSDGNDYAVGLDENGNLTTEMVPAAIHIVVPPRKLKYKDGETLDFTGIHVYLMDGNNKRYTDSSYPTGEIPFGELLFPETIATAGDGGKTSDLDTSPIEKPIYATGGYAVYEHGSSDVQVKEVVRVEGEYCVSYVATNHKNAKSIYASDRIGNASWTYEVYHNNKKIDAATIVHYATESYTHNGKTVYYSATNYGVTQYELNGFVEVETLPNKDGAIAWTLVYGDSEGGGGNSIPVQWMRSDGEILEDTFEIEIVSEEQPVPAPEPDPWGGYADVSWGGHHYNLNRRLVPPVQYSNGYCWRQQASEYIAEYTVEQAASMGWLILIR